MIADMIHNKKLDSIVPELFITGRKLNISHVFITQSYSKVPKDVRLNTTHFFIAKIPNRRELQEIEASIHPILKLKISPIFMENVLLNHIHFLLMTLCLHQIILYDLENYF